MFVNENQLDEWVRGNARDAQGSVVELVWRLVAASSPRPKERRFPLGDSIGQPGPDGSLDVDFPFEPFVPEGRSFWEIGTGLDAGAKATSDYNDLTKATPEDVRLNSTFVFVTPLSGRRDWQHTWKEDAQIRWLDDRRKRQEWRDVRVLDGTNLIDWLRAFPSVALWLAKTMRISAHQIDTPEAHWSVLRTIGEPPPLPPEVFLASRDEARNKLQDVLVGNALQLRLETHYPDQLIDFVSAHIAAMDLENRADVLGRSLIVSGVDAWNELVTQRDRHVLVADPSVDLSGDRGTKMLERARRAGHAVVFAGLPGGIPHPNSAPIPNPRTQHVQEALNKSGYAEERARTLAHKSAGNLGSLLRCLQNASLLPEWAEGSAASELAVAMFLAGWKESTEEDQHAVEAVSGKAYGEWIGTMRDVATRPGTPLVQRDGTWRFVERYEGWYALGPRLFDDHLSRLQRVATEVLRYRDPALDLPKEERYAASIHGKVLPHSNVLRSSLAETLALLGSHPKALTSCTVGRAEGVAAIAVREILADADSTLWASLNQHLPLLAEASPTEFLDAVEAALTRKPSPFEDVFKEEGDGIFGGTYISGLLWALETLAWDAEYLGRATTCLAELAALDPGGRWSNRPINSLTTILLPWLPQTCASVARRAAAVASLQVEVPDIAWKLLLDLLPDTHSTSMGTRKPEWRRFIPDDWSRGVTGEEYWRQVDAYATQAVEMAKADLEKLVQLVDRLDHLPPTALDAVLAILKSRETQNLPEEPRTGLWTKLVDLVTKHQRHADAAWAMPKERTAEVAGIADSLAPRSPFFEHQRLFSERDFELYEGTGSWEDKAARLEDRRRAAIRELIPLGSEKMLEFANEVQSPWRVGISLGEVADGSFDALLLPSQLCSDDPHLAQLLSGFVWGRFRSQSWSWVDALPLRDWPLEERGRLFTHLPFRSETWNRVDRLLDLDQSPYWKATRANPYEAEDSIEYAVLKLLDHGRPASALRCIRWAMHVRKPVGAALTVRALLAAVQSDEVPHSSDGHEIAEVISALQIDPLTDKESLSRIEWAYLPVLNDIHGASAKTLEARLASDPAFFCEVVRLVFRSKHESDQSTPNGDDASRLAQNAYRLLTKWHRPPGSSDEEPFVAAHLQEWIARAKEISSASGHLEVAMTMLGHALVHVPPDPDGLWIHRGAAWALNARDAGDMRDGFRVELYNSRGVHGFSAGKAEHKLSMTYREKAAALDDRGFHRFAGTLKELADTYEREAERASKRDAFGE